MLHMQSVVEEKRVVGTSVMTRRAVSMFEIPMNPAEHQPADEARGKSIGGEPWIRDQRGTPQQCHQRCLLREFAREAKAPRHSSMVRKVAISPEPLRNSCDRRQIKCE